MKPGTQSYMRKTIYLRINDVAKDLGGTFTSHDVRDEYIVRHGNDISIQRVSKYMSASSNFVMIGHTRGKKRADGCGYGRAVLYRCNDGKRVR